MGSQVCDACKAGAHGTALGPQEAAASRPTGYQNWGGGRLGAGEPSDPVAVAAPSAPSFTERVGETTSAAGKSISEAASSVGESLSGMGSWMRPGGKALVTPGRKSVSSITGGEEKEAKEAKGGQAFKAFEGSGRPLGEADRSAARSAAAEAALRRQGVVPRADTQLKDDEALARRLQEQPLGMRLWPKSSARGLMPRAEGRSPLRSAFHCCRVVLKVLGRNLGFCTGPRPRTEQAERR